VQIDQVKEYIRSELQQRSTMEFLQRNSTVTVTPISEHRKDPPVIDVTDAPRAISEEDEDEDPPVIDVTDA
jgi:hypothetical protein